jgi:hypothetical protein
MLHADAGRAPGLSAQTEIFAYDNARYDFAESIRQILSCPDLSQLHACRPDLDYERLTDVTDQDTEFHKRFYGSLDRFLPLYVEFVRDVVKPRFGAEELVYQRVPSFRVHLPNNVAVGNFHRDSDYSHADGEVNFWLPVTNARGSNSVWLESAPDNGDYQPMTVDYGKVLIFDGVNLRHGNRTNETDRTRVSFDFRVVSPDRFRGREDRSFSAGLEMKIGSYFDVV